MKGDTTILFKSVELLVEFSRGGKTTQFLFRYQEPEAGLVEANMSKMQYYKISRRTRGGQCIWGGDNNEDDTD